jgi:hypothetical protein
MVTCWMLVVIGTGIALWWPQGAARMTRAFVQYFALKGRPFGKACTRRLVSGWRSTPWHSRSRVCRGPDRGTGCRCVRMCRGRRCRLHRTKGRPSSHDRHGVDASMTMDEMLLSNVMLGGRCRQSAERTDGRERGTHHHRLCRRHDASRRYRWGYEIALPASADGVYTVMPPCGSRPLLRKFSDSSHTRDWSTAIDQTLIFITPVFVPDLALLRQLHDDSARETPTSRG